MRARLSLLALLVLLAPSLAACECVDVSVRYRFMSATHVFTGTFTEVSTTHTMKVDEWFEGEPFPVIAFQDAGMCTTSRPREARSALIFAVMEDGKLFEMGCSSVPLPSEAGERELRTLRRRAWLWRLERRAWRLFRRS